MKETILARWNELSTAMKMLLNQKATFINTEQEPPIDIITQLAKITSEHADYKSLVIAEDVSDAIFLKELLDICNPRLSVQLLLPHHVSEKLHLEKANITITTASLFALAKVRNYPLTLSDLNLVIVEQSLSPEFLYDLFFANNENPAYFADETNSLLLSTDFKAFSHSITKMLPIESTQESVSPSTKVKREKISLKLAKETVAESIDEPIASTKATATEQTPSQESEDAPVLKKARTTKAADPQAIATEEAQPAKAKTQKITLSIESEKVDDTAPSEFIAMVPRNLQRQYIRDYIREHNLQNTLIVTHNRQSARLLEKYLYRARIRSRIVHEKIDDETATSLFDRYNQGQFNVLILMHRVVQDLADKIEKCDAVMFLDFPSVYSEYADRIVFTRQKFTPKHLISIASENDRAWVDALIEEYPDLNLPTLEIDIEPPKRRQNNTADEKQNTPRTPKKNFKERKVASQAQPKDEAQHVQAPDNIAPETQTVAPAETPQTNHDSKQARDRRPARKENTRQSRPPQQRDRNESRGRNQRNRNDQQPSHNHQPDHYETGDSQSDFFSRNQDEIVNQNRLPFGSGSFEANIARENRRRGRDPFGGTPGGLGQSSNGNFIQNLTQGFAPNQNPNEREPGKRQNNRGRNTPNNRGRKK